MECMADRRSTAVRLPRRVAAEDIDRYGARYGSVALTQAAAIDAAARRRLHDGEGTACPVHLLLAGRAAV
jgi:hypothetical protein